MMICSAPQSVASGDSTSWSTRPESPLACTHHRGQDLDFAPERINVNAVCPAFLATAMVRPFLEDPDLSKALPGKSPWPELGTAGDASPKVIGRTGCDLPS
jgi:NAD(P)-dependent dehydrogenase (short-subunit alcohol dehydrogenase family)